MANELNMVVFSANVEARVEDRNEALDLIHQAGDNYFMLQYFTAMTHNRHEERYRIDDEGVMLAWDWDEEEWLPVRFNDQSEVDGT